MAEIVMVASGWHGGWALTPIARELRALGHEVFTPTLTGLGERSHLAHAAVNLETHIEDVANVVLFERLSGIILCGDRYRQLVTSLPTRHDIIRDAPQDVASIVLGLKAASDSGKQRPTSPSWAHLRGARLCSMEGGVGCRPSAHSRICARSRAAGGELDDAVRVTIYLIDLQHFAVVNETMARSFREPYPARVTIAVAALPRGAEIEIDCILDLGS